MALEQGLQNNLEQTLRQDMVLNPQQLQSLEILQASAMELENRVNRELAENPSLELAEPPPAAEDGADGDGEPAEAPVADPVGELAADAAAGETAGDVDERDAFLASLAQIDEGWQDYLPPAHALHHHGADDEEKRQYFFDSLTAGTSLQDELLAQLRTSGATGQTLELAEQLVGNIDDAGYLRADLDELATGSGAGRAAWEKALALVQACEPAGIGARDLRECLLLQLDRLGRRRSLAWKLADKYLDKLARNHVPEVVRALGITPEQLYAAWEELRRLRPRPGGLLGDDQIHYIVPEVIIEEDGEGGYTVTSNHELTPRLRISTLYRKLLENPETPPEVRDYVRQKVLSGNQLIKSLDQRRDTIQRIAERLVEHQRDFFAYGPEYLRPLTMGEIARELEVHETTVSRAVAGKYVQTPRGTLPLRQFFGGGYEAGDGEELAAQSIREKIRQLVSEENPRKPLSDQRLMELLAEQGIELARRTVAKYREELNIPSSHRRKIHGRG